MTIVLKTTTNIKDNFLSHLSPQDKKWDSKRSETEYIIQTLQSLQAFPKWSAAMNQCSSILKFANSCADVDTKKSRFILKSAFFCHKSHCPVCNWRKSLMRYTRFLNFLPAVLAKYPKARFVLLTLTVPNVPITELRVTLKLMSKAWHKFVKRKEFALVKGWIRSLEVTMEKTRDGYAHPHFHCLLMVSPSWFTHSYTNQFRWTQIWQECMGLDEKPIVDIRVVKGGTEKAALEILKTLNYSIKPEALQENPDWMIEYFQQVHHMKFIASGKAFKDVFKNVENATNEDLIHADTDSKNEQDDGKRIAFVWEKKCIKYKRFPQADEF